MTLLTLASIHTSGGYVGWRWVWLLCHLYWHYVCFIRSEWWPVPWQCYVHKHTQQVVVVVY